MESPVMPTILGGLRGIRVTGTASLEVLVPPPLSDLLGQTIDCYSYLSKTPSLTGA
jgi:hypothetical protein